jgi:hypothetical protein
MMQLFRYAILGVILLIAATGTLSARGLYADGPFWLYHMLLHGGFYIFDIHRAYAQFVVELPVFLAIEGGIRDLNILMRVHSFGLIGIPILFWCGALILQWRTAVFWWLTLAFTVTYLRSGFFAAGEFNTAYGLVALSVAIILKRNLNSYQNILLLSSAIILTHAYESMLFIGVFLAFICVYRLWRRESDSGFTRFILFLSCGLYLYAAFVGVRSTFFFRAENLKTTINYGAFFEPHVLYLLWMMGCAFLVMLKPITFWIKGVIALLGAVVSCLYLIYVWRWDASGISYGYYSYAYRSLGAFMLLGILFLAWFLCAQPFNFFRNFFQLNERLLAYVVSAVFCVQAGLLLVHTSGYYSWLKAFEAEALVIEGLVPIDETQFNKGRGPISGYNWPWTNSTLSVLLRGNAEGIITNARGFDGWETFDPKTIDKYPLKPFVKSGRLLP